MGGSANLACQGLIDARQPLGQDAQIVLDLVFLFLLQQQSRAQPARLLDLLTGRRENLPAHSALIPRPPPTTEGEGEQYGSASDSASSDQAGLPQPSSHYNSPSLPPALAVSPRVYSAVGCRASVLPVGFPSLSLYPLGKCAASGCTWADAIPSPSSPFPSFPPQLFRAADYGDAHP